MTYRQLNDLIAARHNPYNNCRLSLNLNYVMVSLWDCVMLIVLASSRGNPSSGCYETTNRTNSKWHNCYCFDCDCPVNWVAWSGVVRGGEDSEVMCRKAVGLKGLGGEEARRDNWVEIPYRGYLPLEQPYSSSWKDIQERSSSKAEGSRDWPSWYR